MTAKEIVNKTLEKASNLGISGYQISLDTSVTQQMLILWKRKTPTQLEKLIELMDYLDLEISVKKKNS